MTAAVGAARLRCARMSDRFSAQNFVSTVPAQRRRSHKAAACYCYRCRHLLAALRRTAAVEWLPVHCERMQFCGCRTCDAPPRQTRIELTRVPCARVPCATQRTRSVLSLVYSDSLPFVLQHALLRCLFAAVAALTRRSTLHSRPFHFFLFLPPQCLFIPHSSMCSLSIVLLCPAVLRSCCAACIAVLRSKRFAFNLVQRGPQPST
jgi:hypothetical protein